MLRASKVAELRIATGITPLLNRLIEFGSPNGLMLTSTDSADDTLTADEVAARTGVPIAAALALLTELELRGLVRQMPGLRFRRAA